MKYKFIDSVWLWLRVAVGLVFASAGLLKLLAPIEDFIGILANYPVLPDFLIHPIAQVLPWIEWLGGTLLILGYAPRVVATLLASLSFTFMMILISSFLTGSFLGPDCGCFGGMGIHLSPRQIFLIDLINCAILLRLVYLRKFRLSVDAWLRRTGVSRE
ncbi:MAG: DoxX family membrane protein [Chlamydiae bacterium]|nr:DoxX family membrane protein [Chlamydiota bacterium]